MQLEELVGQQLMIGIPGTKLTPEAVRLFQEIHAGGFIIFRPNFESADAFRKLLSDLETALGRKLLVAVDHEGGRVIHLAEGITVFPDNLCIGNGSLEQDVREQGKIEASELRALGIDLNLAPTIDVLRENYSPNIGIRSYGKDPDLVSHFAEARIRGMQSYGLSACAKHFPGQGHSPMDCHLDLPVLSSPVAEIEEIHLKPFQKAIAAGVDTIMSSHPIYPELDNARQPATFSRKIIYDLLRKKMKFEGVILSDDLEMGALRGLCSIGEAAVRAVKAGHDMVLVCHDAGMQREVFQALLKAYESGELDRRELEASVARIQTLKARRKDRFQPGKGNGEALAKKMADAGVRVIRPGKIPAHSKVNIIFPKLSELEKRIFIEPQMGQETAYIKEVLHAYPVSIASVQTLALDPNGLQIGKAVEFAKGAEWNLVFLYEAHLYPGIQEFLKKIQTLGPKCAVILLRNPYDETFIQSGTVCVAAYGFRDVQIRAAVRKLFS